MAKTLKFDHCLVQEVQDGRKAVTWRLFDDKDLRVGDQIGLIDKESGEKFAEAEIMGVREKKLGQIEETDFEGHETYANPEEILRWFQAHYGDRVTMETEVKMVEFKVLHFSDGV